MSLKLKEFYINQKLEKKHKNQLKNYNFDLNQIGTSKKKRHKTITQF